MLWMSSYNVKEGRMMEFQQWIKKNEDLTQKHAPRGGKYRGAYAYVLGFGRYGCSTMWECDKYGDFDAFREHDDETWIRLNQDFIEFTDQTTGESVLLREIGDTRILEPEKPKP